jgi:hypothetical protein
VLYAGYDSDEYASRNSSMVLEALPFQNQFENLLSQHLYSVRQNLINISFIDEEAVEKSWLDKLRNMGEKLVRGVNLIPFSSKIWSRKQLRPENVVQNFRFPQLNTQETMTAMNMVLDIMDRVLLMSKQELGQQASHEQSREEVRILSQTGSTRLQFTAMPLNQMREAKKVMLYKGLMAYGEDEFYAQIPTEEYVTPELLAEVGFTADQSTLSAGLESARSMDPNRKETMTLKVSKSQLAIPLHMFAATRDGSDRVNNAEGGAAMLQFVAQATTNPNWVTAAGMPQLMDLTNMALQIMGFPRDFRIRFTGKDPEEQATELQQMVQGVLQQVDQKLAPIDEGLQKHGQVIKALAEAMQMQLPSDGANAV